MYEVMHYWENVDLAGQSAAARDFAGIWRSADKIVYSSSLPAVTTARTRIERSFDPEAIRALKQRATSASAARPSPPTQSAPAWSMSMSST
jgi:hypothetical protein